MNKLDEVYIKRLRARYVCKLKVSGVEGNDGMFIARRGDDIAEEIPTAWLRGRVYNTARTKRTLDGYGITFMRSPGSELVTVRSLVEEWILGL